MRSIIGILLVVFFLAGCNTKEMQPLSDVLDSEVSPSESIEIHDSPRVTYEDVKALFEANKDVIFEVKNEFTENFVNIDIQCPTTNQYFIYYAREGDLSDYSTETVSPENLSTVLQNDELSSMVNQLFDEMHLSHMSYVMGNGDVEEIMDLTLQMILATDGIPDEVGIACSRIRYGSYYETIEGDWFYYENIRDF